MSNDSGEPGGGGRLRWWQEEQKEQPNAQRERWYVMPPAPQEKLQSDLNPTVQMEPLDIGEELEAEARRRSALEQQHREQEWVIEGSYALRAKSIRKRLLTTFAWVAAIEITLAFLSQSFLLLGMTAFLGLYFTLIYALVSAQLRRLRPLRVGVSPVGIAVAGPNYSGFLRWHEVKSVEQIQYSQQRFLAITPTDPRIMDRFTYSKRGEKARRFRKRNRWLFRKLPEAVYLLEDTLPITADAFLTRVATFQSAALTVRQG